MPRFTDQVISQAKSFVCKGHALPPGAHGVSTATPPLSACLARSRAYNSTGGVRGGWFSQAKKGPGRATRHRRHGCIGLAPPTNNRRASHSMVRRVKKPPACRPLALAWPLLQLSHSRGRAAVTAAAGGAAAGPFGLARFCPAAAPEQSRTLRRAGRVPPQAATQCGCHGQRASQPPDRAEAGPCSQPRPACRRRPCSRC